ncbi:MAG: ABC transporter permease subunit, partial [Planctomycetaceae bacterium]|nr:ABC transporter permease subunit [Planctomycetaceae bacterium]
MLIGPVFSREVAAVPRRDANYFLRSVYAGVFLLLTATAWLVVSGTQLITDTGDFARFGSMLFQFLAPVQLVLSVFLAATLSAAAVGQEKERKTLLLLLLTRMSNSELVLGKLLASLLNIILMLAVSLPVFMT